MYCSCSNKNNYEVISLCDIKKFTDKNGPFNNKGWVQISIADVLMLDCNKLSIEKIEKIYVNVDITSTKIIETPISPSPNSEGMVLTGKKLLIDGYICSKIVYTSLTKEQSVYTSNFTVPFCTYIIIDATADPFNDKYCIKSCIEDVFLSLIDCKTIFQNATLFLLAEKVSFTCPSPQTPSNDCTITNNIIPPQPVPPQPDIPTTFINHIILNSINDTPVIDISFNNLNKEIIVTSTGNTTDPASGNDYFTFTLYEADGTTEKLYATIGGNEDGMNFSTQISNQNFQEGDIVKIQAETPDKVIITNYPDSNTQSYSLSNKEKRFKITKDGLRNNDSPSGIELLNFIYIKTTTTPVFGSIHFDTINKCLFPKDFTEKFSDDGVNYFILNIKLYDLNSSRILDLTLNSIDNLNGFFNTLSETKFDYGYVLELTYNDAFKNQIKIRDFPNVSQTYTPNAIREYYKINPGGLVTHNPMPSTITIFNNTTNITVFTIAFDTTNKLIIVNKDDSSLSPTDSFSIEAQSNNTLIFEYDTNSHKFVKYNDYYFDYNNNSKFEFGVNVNVSLRVTNFPNMGNDLVIPPSPGALRTFYLTINGLRRTT